MKYYFVAIALLLLVAVLLFCLNYSNNQKVTHELKYKYDTVLKEIKTDPIVIEKKKAIIKYIKDTIIITKPFEAKIDTVIKMDTIKMYYQFPENRFSLFYKRKTDTIPIITKTIVKYEKAQWWERPLFFLGGATLGFVLGDK